MLGKLREIIEETSACGLVRVCFFSACAKTLAMPKRRPKLPTLQKSLSWICRFISAKLHRFNAVFWSIGPGQCRVSLVPQVPHTAVQPLCSCGDIAEMEEHVSRSYCPRQVVGWPLTKSGTAEGQCLMVLQFLRQLRQKGKVSHVVAAAEHDVPYVCCMSAVYTLFRPSYTFFRPQPFTLIRRKLFVSRSFCRCSLLREIP